MPDATLIIARPAAADRRLWLRYARPLLNTNEQAALERSIDPIGAAEHAVGRALVRLIGSGSTGLDPAELSFSQTAGRPVLSHIEDLRLSVAHSRRTLVVAACGAAHVGVDVEAPSSLTLDPCRLAHRFFAPSEARALERRPICERREWFIRAWTIKEAVGKALGVGLAPALRGVVVGDAGGEIALERIWLEADPASWTLHQLRPSGGEEHLTLAVHAPDVTSLNVVDLDLAAFVEACVRRRLEIPAFVAGWGQDPQ